jgi:hypothetical protein
MKGQSNYIKHSESIVRAIVALTKCNWLCSSVSDVLERLLVAHHVISGARIYTKVDLPVL